MVRYKSFFYYNRELLAEIVQYFVLLGKRRVATNTYHSRVVVKLSLAEMLLLCRSGNWPVDDVLLLLPQLSYCMFCNRHMVVPDCLSNERG